MAGGTAYVTDARMLAHDPGPGHPEHPGRLRVLQDRVAAEPGLVRLPAREATVEELGRVHSSELIELVEATSRHPRVRLDPDTTTSPGSSTAARLAAGAVVELCQAVAAGQVQNGIALVRPPGHHAEHDRAMGFCLYNNVAVAAQALRAGGLARVAILDWDLHHGNGTQHVFEADPSVLYVSTHQFPFYPGTGAATDVGRGPGAGRTLNLPCAAGFGDAELARGFDEVIVPVLRQFRPDFLLVSAGFDCDGRDPLGALEVTPAGFARMARACRAIAEECAGGRLAVVLEGGYDEGALLDGVGEVLAALTGRAGTPGTPRSGDAARAEAMLARVRAAQAPYWTL